MRFFFPFTVFYSITQDRTATAVCLYAKLPVCQLCVMLCVQGDDGEPQQGQPAADASQAVAGVPAGPA